MEARYRQLLEEALKDLEEVCKSRGYDLKYDFKQDSGGRQAINLTISNPINGGHVRLEIWGARYKDDIDNVHIVRNEAKGTAVDYMRQMITQVEILVEELSRKGLSMRDEVAARKLALNLLCMLSFMPTWREIATISRISLEYGFKFNCGEHGLLSVDKYNVRASEKSVDAFLRDYRETYGIDRNFVKDVQALMKYNARPYPNVIEKYFPKDVIVLSMLGERDLNDIEYSFVRKVMFESKRDMRLEYAWKILHKLTENIPESRKKQLRLLANEYLEKVASETEALTLLKRIIDYGWMYWFARDNVENAKVFAKIVEKVIGVENIIDVDWKSPDRGKNIPIVATKDGFSIFLMMPVKNFFKIVLYPRSKMFSEKPYRPYASLKIHTDTKIGKRHLKYARMFVKEGKNYFRTALMRGREMLMKDETLLAYVKASSIAGNGLKISIPAVEIEIGSNLPEEEAFINALKNEFNRKLESLEVVAGKIKVGRMQRLQQ